jgi:hypothetical protein
MSLIRNPKSVDALLTAGSPAVQSADDLKGRVMDAKKYSAVIRTQEDTRRGFVRKVCGLTAGLAAGRELAFGDLPDARLPQIQLGNHAISRLICGGNPFHAGSHLSIFVDREMRAYYTDEQVLRTLKRCQQVGINCWQSSGTHYQLYRRFVDEGGDLHYISLGDARPDRSPGIYELAKAGCIAVAHHGELTDRFFKSGQIEQVEDYLKRVHDAGLLAGVSTHMPVVVDAIESKGWEVDFYMTCLYERHRTAPELEKLLGQAPIPVGEVYLPGDPPRMWKVMQQADRPCLAFKMLAAGRLSERQEWVEQAFRQTFSAIKPEDGVIIGIYDRYSDQAGENADLVRRCAGTDISFARE